MLRKLTDWCYLILWIIFFQCHFQDHTRAQNCTCCRPDLEDWEDNYCLDVSCKSPSRVLVHLETTTGNRQACDFGDKYCFGITPVLMGIRNHCYWHQRCSLPLPKDRLIPHDRLASTGDGEDPFMCLFKEPFFIRVNSARCARANDIYDVKGKKPKGKNKTENCDVKEKKPKGKNKREICDVKEKKPKGKNKKENCDVKGKKPKGKHKRETYDVKGKKQKGKNKRGKKERKRKKEDNVLRLNKKHNQGIIRSHPEFPWAYKEFMFDNFTEYNMVLKWRKKFLRNKTLVVGVRVLEVCETEQLTIRSCDLTIGPLNDTFNNCTWNFVQASAQKTSTNSTAAGDASTNGICIPNQQLHKETSRLEILFKGSHLTNGCEGFLVCFKVYSNKNVPSGIDNVCNVVADETPDKTEQGVGTPLCMKNRTEQNCCCPGVRSTKRCEEHMKAVEKLKHLKKIRENGRLHENAEN